MSQATPSSTPVETKIPRDDNRLVWVDMEMTGLDPFNDKIIEVAVVVTDSELNVLEEGPVLAIHQSDEILAGMDAWNTSTHGKSGLTARVKESTIDEAQAEDLLIEFLAKYIGPGKSPMCGNSICQDRRFMAKYMPKLEAYFHYRNLDVSTLKELCKRWNPTTARKFVKKPSTPPWPIFTSQSTSFVFTVSILLWRQRRRRARRAPCPRRRLRPSWQSKL